MTNKYHQKYKENLRKEAREIKIFMNKKKTKGEEVQKSYQNLTKEEKEEKVIRIFLSNKRKS